MIHYCDRKISHAADHQKQANNPPLCHAVQGFIGQTGSNGQSPERLAALVKLLIQHEVSPGGPYSHPDCEFTTLNKIIATACADNDINLPNLEPYQEKARVHPRKISSPLNNESRPVPKSVLTALNQLDPQMRNDALTIAQKLSDSPGGLEIITLCSSFASDLDTGNSGHIQQYAESADTANFLAWISYWVYDKVFDNGTHTHLLPVANIICNQSLVIHTNARSKLLGRADTQVQASYDTVNTAMFLDAKHYRRNNAQTITPSARLLSEKSIGHLLGPFTILDFFEASARNTQDHQTVRKLLVRHLELKQICDDIEDIDEDFANGHLNYYSAWLIKKANPGLAGKHLSENHILEAKRLSIKHQNTAKLLNRRINEIEALSQQIRANKLGFDKFITSIVAPITACAKGISKNETEKSAFLSEFSNPESRKAI